MSSDNTFTNLDIYTRVAAQMSSIGLDMDFEAIVGNVDDLGGSAAWVQRVTDLADDLEIRAAFVVAYELGEKMRTIRAMFKAHAKIVAKMERAA